MLIIVLFVLFASTFACEDFPNGTATAVHTFQCNGPNPTFELVSAKIMDSEGHQNYPIDLSKPIVFHYDIINHANHSFDNLRSDSEFDEWFSGWLGCYWLPLPTFGVLDNTNPCELGNSCPVKSGPTVIETHVDLSQIAAVLNAITSHHPTQFTVHLKDNTNPNQQVELACVSWQMQFTKDGKYLTAAKLLKH
uniref:ML domain-containing protein n=1 Tax=Plectus sambesii TaxID=2011161 RepID=A0A914X6Z8_9BILA